MVTPKMSEIKWTPDFVIRSLRRRLWKAFQEDDAATACRAYQATLDDFRQWIMEEERRRLEDEASKATRPEKVRPENIHLLSVQLKTKFDIDEIFSLLFWISFSKISEWRIQIKTQKRSQTQNQ